MDTTRLQFIPLRTEKEIAAEIRAIKKVSARARKDSKLALDLLLGTGMYTKAGQLKKRFR